jgi:hypothetical protein
MRLLKIFLTIVVLLGITGCVFTSNEVTTQKARAIYFIPKKVTVEEVKKALKAAIAGRVDNIKEICDFMPEKLPEKPAHPVNKNIFGSLSVIGAGNPSMEAAQLDTTNAYCTLQGSETYGGPFDEKSVIYKAAIYPYKKGYKVYIYEFFQESSNGIMGHLVKASIDKLMSSDSPALFMAQVMDKFQRELPQAKLLNVDPEKIKEIESKLSTYQKEI